MENRLRGGERGSSPLAVVDINTGSIPLRDVSRFSGKRHVAEDPPAKFPVRPPHSHFTFGRSPIFQCCAPLGDDPPPFIGMNGGFPAPTQCFLWRLTRELAPTLVNYIVCADRLRTPNYPPNRL